MNTWKYILIAVLSSTLSLQSCKKDEVQAGNEDAEKISAVIADNFNLSVFSTGLTRTGLKAKMLERGPFTVIAPSDEAFGKAGLGTTVALLAADPNRVAAIMNYHIIDGNYEFNKLPFLFNQEIRSGNGGKLFITHWVKGVDTVLTINGSRVLASNIKASNGLIQVVDQMLEPYTHQLVTDAIASDRELSLFYQALQQANMIALLNEKGPYTIFAPNNAAMRAFGYESLEAVIQADPAVLRTLVRYHVVTDRRFVYDYILSTGTNGVSEQSMLDGNSIQVQLIADAGAAGGYSGIRLKGTGNTTVIPLVKRDVLTGNGVLHTIGSVLKITQ